MKRAFRALLLILALASAVVLSPYTQPSAWSRNPWVDVTWEGGTDLDMLHQVQADLKAAKEQGKGLRVRLISPGGPVIFCLEMGRLIRNASDAGTVVEIHGTALVASCGTFVLASGTPGHRYITDTTLFLVHPMQSGGFGGLECVVRPEKQETQEEKIVESLYDLMEYSYARYTGHDPLEVREWLVCGNETVGAHKAVEMGIADRVER